MTDWPRISIVTSSFNPGRYLEAAMRSVLDQSYPNLEYIVIDGGSTDGSVDIIRKYADRLAYWVSEPDGGQMDAINKALFDPRAKSWPGSTPTICSAPGRIRRWRTSSTMSPRFNG